MTEEEYNALEVIIILKDKKREPYGKGPPPPT